VLAGAGCAGAAALSGCSTYGKSSGDKAAPTPAGNTSTQPASVPDSSTLAKVADIPIGGGKIFPGQKIIVTQPQPGTIKAFSSTCTHMGCTVRTVTGGTINCPCHGSKFKIADGSVANGPAATPLPPVSVTVKGDAISVA